MNTQQGIVKIVILLIIALLILSYYGFDLRKTVESPSAQSNFSYVKEFVVNVWHKYLERPVMYAWNFFMTYIWGPAITNLQNLNNRKPMDMQQQMPAPIPMQRAN